ncbi:MAG: SLC13 family permease [Verrucomicrobiales bacterium]|nr:SLC13 family permease [Verrucomicrobiales bacterium]
MSALAICLAGMVVVLGAIIALRLHAFVSLLLGALTVAVLSSTVGASGTSISKAVTAVTSGFGTACGKVGVIIALAAIIGQCLLASGAAERIVKAILGLFGAKRAPIAFLSSGFILGIPVFFDTVFYLMFPLLRSYARKVKGTYVLCVLATVAGASMAHSLVPPTPGPLYVANSLGVSLGVMIPAGLVLGVICIACGYIYAKWANRRFDIPFRDDEAAADKDVLESRPLPSLFLSLLPVVGPLILIAATSFPMMPYQKGGALADQDPGWLGFWADKNLALGLGAVVALFIATKYRNESDGSIKDLIQNSLSGAGIIILITAAGGAFGQVLKESGIAQELVAMFPNAGDALLPIAFVVTALVRIAQGSATVSMITGVGIVAPLLETMMLSFHPVYLALAIGCGSKPGPWMNDSGFWVVGRMAKFTETETLKTFSVLLTVMGVAGFIVCWICSKVFPMV